MAFVNTVFPDLKLKHGIAKQVIDPVMITGNGAREVRRRQNRWERFVWNIQSRNVLEATKQEILVFLRGMNISQDSFLFRDPTLPTLNGAQLPIHTSGPVTYRQMVIPYVQAGAGSSLTDRLKHPIWNPRVSDFVFRNNGVVTTATFVGIVNGVPVVNVVGANAATIVTVTGPVYLTARFSGNFTWSIAAMELPVGGTCASVTPTIDTMDDFQLIEVYE